MQIQSDFGSQLAVKVRILLRAMVLGLVALAAVSAQTITTGDITGTIKDASGAVVPNATDNPQEFG